MSTEMFSLWANSKKKTHVAVTEKFTFMTTIACSTQLHSFNQYLEKVVSI